jgi:hypothetical protein
MQSNVKEGVLFADPTTDEDRERVANSCVRNLHIAIPALIDSINNHVEQDYTGWPDRLYLIDKAEIFGSKRRQVLLVSTRRNSRLRSRSILQNVKPAPRC